MKKLSKHVIHRRAFGYEPGRMKPVHLATGFFLALTGHSFDLEWLNKASVTSSRKGLEGDYLNENLIEILRERGTIGPKVELRKFKALRQQIQAAVDNDRAVWEAFRHGSSPFGNDYTSTSARFVTDPRQNRHKDGYAGFFIASVLERSASGKEICDFARQWITYAGDPFERFVNPLLDAPSEGQDWENLYISKFGEIGEARLEEVSVLMQEQTSALARLCRNMVNSVPHHSRLRFLILGLSCWLLMYMIREAGEAVEYPERQLLFMDFLGNPSSRCRAQSKASFARHRECIYRSYLAWQKAGRFAADEENFQEFHPRDKKTGNLRDPDFKFLEEHFSDLAVRAGIAQPRTAQVRQKHYECQPDTIRMLANSLIPINELVPFTKFADDLKATWGITFGGCVNDHAELQESGYLGLDEDDDLKANREACVQLLKTMDLAAEPSDGLVLCAIRNDLLP